jgi:hypothetical protein
MSNIVRVDDFLAYAVDVDEDWPARHAARAAERGDLCR